MDSLEQRNETLEQVLSGKLSLVDRSSGTQTIFHGNSFQEFCIPVGAKYWNNHRMELGNLLQKMFDSGMYSNLFQRKDVTVNKALAYLNGEVTDDPKLAVSLNMEYDPEAESVAAVLGVSLNMESGRIPGDASYIGSQVGKLYEEPVSINQLVMDANNLLDGDVTGAEMGYVAALNEILSGQGYDTSMCGKIEEAPVVVMPTPALVSEIGSGTSITGEEAATAPVTGNGIQGTQTQIGVPEQIYVQIPGSNNSNIPGFVSPLMGVVGTLALLKGSGMVFRAINPFNGDKKDKMPYE